MSDETLSEAFLWLWEHRFTEAQRDEWRAMLREMGQMVERAAPVVQAWENAGIEAAEKHANGER